MITYNHKKPACVDAIKLYNGSFPIDWITSRGCAENIRGLSGCKGYKNDSQ